eukprot:381423-Pelagomonas_calceolata.AAC.1
MQHASKHRQLLNRVKGACELTQTDAPSGRERKGKGHKAVPAYGANFAKANKSATKQKHFIIDMSIGKREVLC